MVYRFKNYKADSIEEAQRIDSNVTKVFLKYFERLTHQIDGIDLIKSPTDESSYYEFHLGELKSSHILINELIQIGMNSINIREAKDNQILSLINKNIYRR